MNEIKKTAINNLANRLINILNLNVPIKIEKIPEILGGKIHYVDGAIEGKMEAMIKKDGEDSFTILIDKTKSELRQRFSIAHELGHLFLHMGYIINPKLWEEVVDYKDSVYYRFGYSKEELEANEFAGAFLMPESEFIHIAQQNLNQGYYNIAKIAEHFNVSIKAAKVRGNQLRLFS